ncbi:MAG: hypothetical protein QM373_06320, partial [Bacillota bacterium]|nr:hypothetical protein [Bacillota bacterium]
MEPEVLFYIYTFPVSQPLLFTWIIMAVVALTGFLLSRNLPTIPRGAQHLLEVAVEGSEGVVVGDIGREGKGCVPLVLGVAVLVGVW